MVALENAAACINPLNSELNPIWHLLALLGAHHIFHVNGLSVNSVAKFSEPCVVVDIVVVVVVDIIFIVTVIVVVDIFIVTVIVVVDIIFIVTVIVVVDDVIVIVVVVVVVDIIIVVFVVDIVFVVVFVVDDVVLLLL